MTELKRRDLSGIFIYDKFPNDEKRMPTCLEDCLQSTRREWCLSSNKEELHSTIQHLADTFKDMCNYLVDEKCVTDEQRKKMTEMIDRNVDRSKWNWAVHELAEQVDFFCEKLVMLADACGVTKHLE